MSSEEMSNHGFIWNLTGTSSWVLLYIAAFAVIFGDRMMAICWLPVGVISFAWLRYSGAFDSKKEATND